MSTDPTQPPDQPAEYYRGALHTMIDMSVDMARMVHQRAKTEAEAETPGPAPETVAAFNDTARNVRRSILLAQKTMQPPAADRAQSRFATRKRIIRAVEDTIQRHATGAEAEHLHGELLDRLDAPDLDGELDDRPVADIIADLCRDLGLDIIPGAHPWKRRTPEDIALLCARAAAPQGERVARVAPASPSAPRPQSDSVQPGLAVLPNRPRFRGS